MSEKKRKYSGRTIAKKLEVIRMVDKKERCKSEMVQACGIPLATLPTCIRNLDSVEQQALQGERCFQTDKNM
jgi:hypothetical protein